MQNNVVHLDQAACVRLEQMISTFGDGGLVGRTAVSVESVRLWASGVTES
jgi:hypothetical protein